MSDLPGGVRLGEGAGRRVVVTGVGAVSALGVGRRALEDGVFSGRSGVRERTLFELAGVPFQKKLNEKYYQKNGLTFSLLHLLLWVLRPLLVFTLIGGKDVNF
mgnify:CR=1 FL=1